MFGFSLGIIILAVLGLIGIAIAVRLATLRVVVPTSDIHVVQSAKHTISYGKDQPAGNVYYHWPSKIPVVGVNVIELPVSVFKHELVNYEAYDKDRVPFVLDVVGFFRIDDSNTAAQRVSSMEVLEEQLEFILKGSIRSILASHDINEILEGRQQFGLAFTQAVDEQLKQWGVQTVKSIELMDIRDAAGSQVIHNIMAKKQSEIEKDSRVAVAANNQAAQTAEVEAARAVEVSKQQAQEIVGIRAAERSQAVGMREQQSQQSIQEQAAITKQKEMEVLSVQQVRTAEIARQAAEVAATQAKNVAILQSEAAQQTKINNAEGDLQTSLKRAQGVQAEGEAKGAAETASLMAPVNSKIALAKEIGQNKEYQNYLLAIRQIEAAQQVGQTQAGALEKADVKIIATSGNPADGAKSVMDLFTPRGALSVGAALEAFKNTEAGKAVVDRLTGKPDAHDTATES